MIENKNLIPQLEAELEEQKTIRSDKNKELSALIENKAYIESTIKEADSAVFTIEETIKLLKNLN